MAWPVLQRANALRRHAVARIRTLDMIQWEGVPYGEDPAQQLHLWEQNDLCPRDGWPAVLLIHGGGWVEGSPQDFEALGPLFCRRGLMVGALGYRLAPGSRWPAQLEDVIAGIERLHGAQADPERIALWGHSAGGQLALMAALTRPDLVRCAVALGAPSDLRRQQEEGPDDLLQVFDPDQLEGASPIAVPCEAPPPILLVHGTADRVCSVEQSRAHAQGRSGVELIEVEDGDHGLRWPPVAALRARRRAISWLVDQLDMPQGGSKWRRRKKEG